MAEIPLIDLGPYLSGEGKAAVARQVDHACRDIGFLLISNHGVPESLIRDTEAISNAFFDLEIDEKMAVVRPNPGVLRGYVPIAAESLAKSLGVAAEGDLNESFMIGDPAPKCDPYYFADAARSHFAANIWPKRPADFQQIWEDYYGAMATLATDLMRVFALALDLPEDFFDGKIDRHTGRLRVRSYPPISDVASTGQTRAGAHTDYGSLTILKPQAAAGGLQVLSKDGQWLDVPDIPGTFVINIGDLMARWTNDRWISTMHRVISPQDPETRRKRRLSMVFFHNPNYDAVISSLSTCCESESKSKYQPVSAGDYLFAKFMSAQAY